MNRTRFAALRIVCLAVSLWALATPASATLPAEQIVVRASNVAYYAGDDARARVRLTISDAAGRERQRDFSLLRRNFRGKAGNKNSGDQNSGDQNFYVHFDRPADIRHTVMLVHKHAGRDDDRWMFLPALDLVKRIAPSDERTSFIGSHYFHEDVSGRDPTEDHHVLEAETEDFYVIRSTPKQTADVEFAHYTSWIHKPSFVPVKVEYVDAANEVYREYTADRVETIDGHPTVVASSMSDHRDGGRSAVELRDVAYDTGIPDTLFTERHLRNPPRELLR